MEPRDTATYPGFDIYKLIVGWIESNHEAGRLLDPNLPTDDPRFITRGNIGSLNTSIRNLIVARNEHLRVR